MGRIKGILIDSGRVLNVSPTGSWSYSPKFFEIVGKEKFHSISKKRREDAYAKAWEYINSISLIPTIEEEWEKFFEFFAILDNQLPELEIKDKKKELTDDFVLNFDKYVFFSDVIDSLPRLSEKYKLCIVSDAWPSLRGVYEKVKLDKYFQSLIISSEIGVTKPNEKMYKSALKSLGLKKDEIVFVDDNLKNCKGADEIGICPIILQREAALRNYYRLVKRTKYKMVKNLYELEEVIERI